MGKRDNETMAEFAQRAIEGFVVKPYEVVDKALREGVREAVDSYNRAHPDNPMPYEVGAEPQLPPALPYN
jgi:hypothetical protein